MNKNELLSEVSKKTGLPRVTVSFVMKTMFETIGKELNRKDGAVMITGYCNFKKVRQKARAARNPNTGETFKTRAKNVVRIKPGKKLSEMVK